MFAVSIYLRNACGAVSMTYKDRVSAECSLNNMPSEVSLIDDYGSRADFMKNDVVAIQMIDISQELTKQVDLAKLQRYNVPQGQVLC